jgi:hypothetical protein
VIWGTLHVILYCPVRFCIVKFGIGGAGFTGTVAVTKQPRGSVADMVTMTGVVRGREYVPTVVLEFRVIGVGAQLSVAGLAADPAGVMETTAMVPPHCACTPEARSKGAGVMVVVTGLAMGLQEPAGCI